MNSYTKDIFSSPWIQNLLRTLKIQYNNTGTVMRCVDSHLITESSTVIGTHGARVENISRGNIGRTIINKKHIHSRHYNEDKNTMSKILGYVWVILYNEILEVAMEDPL